MFQSLFRSQRRSAASRSHSVRPHLEVLENRNLLTIRTVVALGVPFDNVTKFSSLNAALTSAQLKSGDTIQIEPGSAPGEPALLGSVGLTNLTIEGDPAVPQSAIPPIVFVEPTTIGPSETGLVFAHDNIELIDTGSLTVQNTAVTITGSTVSDINSSASAAVTMTGPSDILQDSTFVNVGGPLTMALVAVDPETSGGNNNVINGNTFAANGLTSCFVDYNNSSSNSINVGDQVTNNTFLGHSEFLGMQPFSVTMIKVSGTGQVGGLTIAGNTFTDSGTGAIPQAAIWLIAPGANTQVITNTIDLPVPGATGIVVAGGISGTNTSSAAVIDNEIETGASSSGIAIDAGAGASNALDVMVQGNDLHNNGIGVEINATSGGPLGNVDLGGGTQGSLGGNDFRSFTTNAVGYAAAIALNGTNPASSVTIQAQKNIFASSVANPQSVIYTTGFSNVAVNTAGNLIGNAAFVQTLYEDVLKRVGDTSNVHDAGYYVTGLNNSTLTPAAVVGGIVRSTEALDYQVNVLYESLLGRPADSGGQEADVAYLQAGGTLEQVIGGIATSPEFINRVGSSAGFVEALYVDLLGRSAGASDVSGWVGQLPTVGYGGVVAGILASTEFRTDVVEQLYGAPQAPPVSVVALLAPLLHRTTPPSAAEVQGWLNMNLDMLTMEEDFLLTSEFFVNG
jgi:hypothetical protein